MIPLYAHDRVGHQHGLPRARLLILATSTKPYSSFLNMQLHTCLSIFKVFFAVGIGSVEHFSISKLLVLVLRITTFDVLV